MSQQFQNTFINGIDQDTSVNKYPNTSYYDAVDMRVLSNNSLSVGAIGNINGNKAAFSLDYPFEKIVHSQIIGDDVVLFTMSAKLTGILYTPTGITTETSVNLYVADQSGYGYDSGNVIDVISILISNSTPTPAEMTEYDTYIAKDESDPRLFFNRLTLLNKISDNFHYYYTADGLNAKFTFYSKDVNNNYSIERDAPALPIFNYDSGNLRAASTAIYRIDSPHLVDVSVINSATRILTSSNLGTQDAGGLISTVANIENKSLRKVYFAIEGQPIRSVNIDKIYGTVTTPESTIDLVRTFSQPTFSLSDIPGGSLMCGRYQYAIQYFNSYESSTAFSVASEMISISKYNNKGGSASDSANRSVAIKINGYNPSFDNMRIVAIEYIEDSLNPSVRIVKTIPVIKDESNEFEITVVDSGISNGELSLSYFRLLSQVDYKAKAIESKDNRLFLANVDESLPSFGDLDNWDARAFAYDGYNGSAMIYNTPIGGETEGDRILIDAAGNWTRYNGGTPTGESGTGWGIPASFNCVNRDNSVYYKDCQTPKYSFNPKYSGIPSSRGVLASDKVWGGRGKNVEYSFVKYTQDSSSLSKEDKYNSVGHSLGSGLRIVHGQPDEVYRIGVEFLTEKGQRSFVKWIADVRWPSNSLENTGSSINTMELAVKINSFPAGMSASAKFRIVRARMSSLDRSIATTAIGSPTEKSVASSVNYGYFWNDAGTIHSPASINDIITSSADTGHSMNKSLIELDSPEIMMNNGGQSVDFQNKKIVFNRVLKTSDKYSQIVGGNIVHGIPISSSELIDKTDFADSKFPVHTILDMSYVETPYRVKGSPNRKYNIGGDSYENTLRSSTVISGKNSGAIVKLDSDVVMPSAGSVYNSTGYYPLYVVVSDVDSTRYGGYDISTIESMEFIPFSKATPRASFETVCIHGDTYFKKFDFVRGYYYSYLFSTAPDVYTNSLEEYVNLFLPSRVNNDFRSDSISEYLITDLSEITKDSATIQETVVNGIKLFPENYDEEIGDLYVYNTAYSADNISTINFVKPLNFIDVSLNQVKVLASSNKVNGELIDSWAEIFSNSFIEVDSNYGEITRLINYKGKMLCFQEFGVNLLSINDRSVVVSSSGEVTVGDSGILDRYDYIKYYRGLKNQNEAIATSNAVYFFDRVDNNLYSIGSDMSLSDISSSNSLMTELGESSPSLMFAYDNKFNEIIISNGIDAYCFSDITKKFITRLGASPDSLITTRGSLMSQKVPRESSDLNLNYVYLHDVGDRGEWYSELSNSKAKSTSSITLLINPNGNIVNTFENLDLRTDVYCEGLYPFSNDGALNETVSRIVYGNSYLEDKYVEANVFSEYPNIKRLIRKWRTQVPLTDNGNRFVDTYLKVRIEFDNNNNKAFVLRDVVTSYSNNKNKF